MGTKPSNFKEPRFWEEGDKTLYTTIRANKSRLLNESTSRPLRSPIFSRNLTRSSLTPTANKGYWPYPKPTSPPKRFVSKYTQTKESHLRGPFWKPLKIKKQKENLKKIEDTKRRKKGKDIGEMTLEKEDLRSVISGISRGSRDRSDWIKRKESVSSMTIDRSKKRKKAKKDDAKNNKKIEKKDSKTKVSKSKKRKKKEEKQKDEKSKPKIKKNKKDISKIESLPKISNIILPKSKPKMKLDFLSKKIKKNLVNVISKRVSNFQTENTFMRSYSKSIAEIESPKFQERKTGGSVFFPFTGIRTLSDFGSRNHNPIQRSSLQADQLLENVFVKNSFTVRNTGESPLMNVSSIGNYDKKEFLFDSKIVSGSNNNENVGSGNEMKNATPHFRKIGGQNINLKNLKTFHRDSIGNKATDEFNHPLFQNREISDNYRKSHFRANTVDVIAESEYELEGVNKTTESNDKIKKTQSHNEILASSLKGRETLRKQANGWERALEQSQETDVFVSEVMRQANSGYDTVNGKLGNNLLVNTESGINEIEHKLTFDRKFTLGQKIGNYYY